MTFDNPKPGDPVAFYASRHTHTPTCLTIERVTPTQVIVGGSRYRRNGGGALDHHGRVKPWTTEVDVEIAEQAKLEERTKQRDALSARVRACARMVTSETRTTLDCDGRPIEGRSFEVPGVLDAAALERVAAVVADFERQLKFALSGELVDGQVRLEQRLLTGRWPPE